MYICHRYMCQGIVERRECLTGRKEMEEGPQEERGTACQRIAR